MWTEKSEEILLEVLNKDLKRCWLQEGPEKNESLSQRLKNLVQRKGSELNFPNPLGLSHLLSPN